MMKNKKFAITFLLLFLYLWTSAQTTATDKIYLKNGSFLVGKIVEYNPQDSLVFQIQNGNTMTFPSKLVKKVKMYSETEVRNMYSFRENTFYTRSQLSVLYKKDNSGISFSQSAGYQFRHWLAVGAGIGIDNYRWEQGNNLMPVFLELRTYLLKQNLSPYFSLRVGHSFAFEDKSIGQTEAKGDFFINPAIGYRLGTGFPYIDIFCGAKFQKTQYETLDSWSKSHFDITYRRYDIGLAMTF